MTCGWNAFFCKTRRATPWAHSVHVNKDEMCANVRENTRCEDVLFTLSVCCSGSLSTVNETNCYKKEIRAKKKIVSSLPTPFGCVPPRRTWRWKTNIVILYVGQLERWTTNLQRKLLVLVVCVFVDLDGWALQLVLLIRGVSDFSS